jgi:hypothetical protein
MLKAIGNIIKGLGILIFIMITAVCWQLFLWLLPAIIIVAILWFFIVEAENSKNK